MLNRIFLNQTKALRPAASFRPISSAVRPYRPYPFQSPQVTRPLPSRWQHRFASTKSKAQSEAKEANEAKEAKESAEGEKVEKEDPVQKELEDKKRDVIELKDKYLRSVAEYSNLQERTRREVENARLYGIQRFAGDLLDTVDNLDRALITVTPEKLESPESGPNKELIELHTGLKMTETILLNTLKKHGLERFDPSDLVDGKPQKFDPTFHEATFMVPSPDKENNDVMYTQSKGFKLNGRVLRAAKVGVVRNS